MAPYTYKLNLNFSPFKSHVNLADYKSHWVMMPFDNLSDDLKDWLSDNNLLLKKAGLFHQFGEKFTGIHSDYSPNGDIAKINWQFAENFVMHWYRVKNSTVEKKYVETTTEYQLIPTQYTNYSLDELELVHTETPASPALIQSGPPHNVTNYYGSRHALSVTLFQKNGDICTMELALNLLSKYMEI